MHGLELGEAVLRSDILIHLPGDCVERSLDRFLEFNLSHIGTVIVLGSVLNFLVLHICAGIVSLFKSGRIDDERLDRTARLPVALERAVQ